MIKKVMGNKTLVTYLSSIIGGAIISGLLIDYIFPVNWFKDIASSAVSSGTSSAGMMNSFSWWRIASAIILFGLLIYSFIRQWLKSKNYKKINNKIESKMEEKEFKVDGMVCGHCKASVISNLSKLPFINDIDVDLISKLVKVKGKDIDMEKIRDTVNEIGYEFKEK